MSKDVYELKSEVKKLRKRIRTLEKKKETGVKDPSKDPNNDEVFEIPVQMSVSESTCSCEKCTKAPDAVAALLSALFF